MHKHMLGFVDMLPLENQDLAVIRKVSHCQLSSPVFACVGQRRLFGRVVEPPRLAGSLWRTGPVQCVRSISTISIFYTV